MPVPSDITALSTTAASNSPVGSETPSSIDDYLRSHASFIAQLRAVIGGAVNPNIPTNLGTAATANLTTSATDTTAGRVTKVGDFGRSGGAAIQATDGNIDGYTSSAGTWLFDSNLPHTGSPSNSASWLIDVIPFSVVGDAVRCTQIAYRANGMEAWFRAFAFGVWSTWVEVWTTSNLVKTTSATDTTAGRMLKVGDFGVGAPIPTTNLNTLTGTGLFECGDVTGTPTSLLPGWWVYQIDAGAGFWKNQTAWQQGNPKVQYVRSSLDGTTWGPWIQAIFADSPVFTGTPSGPTAAPGTNTTQFATTAFVLANQSGLGIGQTWQNVLGSRALGTTYTNSTGKPIEVAVSTDNSSNTNSLGVTVGGVSILYDRSSSGTSGHATFIVPAGATYSVASGKTLNRWAELR